jgi:5-formyltetrahydrofolate cyclo-ligase
MTSFGAGEPVDGEVINPSEVDVVVTPAVAFDRSGRRVGYGGGFYDRFLPKTRPDSTRVGIGFDVQLVDDDLPNGHFDLRVDAIVTDAEVVRIEGSR